MFELIWEGFDDLADLCRAYQIEPLDLNGAEILIAKYHTGDYEGSSFVLLRRGVELFEVNGSHCSCFGLENQWDEELTSIEALRTRSGNNSFINPEELNEIEAYLKLEENMDRYPVIVQLVRDRDGTVIYALKEGTPSKPFRRIDATEVELFDSTEHYDAHKAAHAQRNLRESALAKLSAAERKALGL
jgi:hypothetical protein